MRVVKRVLQGLGVLLGLVVVYLAVVTFGPGFDVPAQPLPTRDRSAGTDSEPVVPRRNVSFEVGESRVSGWLYLPEDAPGRVPCVVMATGLGGTKDFLLEAYAARYGEAGFAALTFDYRYFGASGGEPRQLIWIPDQIEDLTGAINYARSLPEIDPARIALWGTSLGGGHVITAASRDPELACGIAQVPLLGGAASVQAPQEGEGSGHGFRMFVHGQRDMARSRLGLSPHKIPIVGRPGTIGLMTTPGAYETFAALAPASYVNEACARIILRGGLYRPVERAQDIRCPVLLQIADRDSLIPPDAADETIRKLGPRADVKHYPIGHFDIYTGDAFEQSVRDQVAFLERCL
jgi:fermentation-respiration switch protein FrsA (DUF1100 family)